MCDMVFVAVGTCPDHNSGLVKRKSSCGDANTDQATRIFFFLYPYWYVKKQDWCFSFRNPDPGLLSYYNLYGNCKSICVFCGVYLWHEYMISPILVALIVCTFISRVSKSSHSRHHFHNFRHWRFPSNRSQNSPLHLINLLLFLLLLLYNITPDPAFLVDNSCTSYHHFVSGFAQPSFCWQHYCH